MSNSINDHLVSVLKEAKFYMTSYIVYLLAAQCPNYPRLTRRGNMQDPRAWPYIVYPQLVQNKLRDDSSKFIIVNDAFIFTNIRFMEGDHAKRMSVETTTRVMELGGVFL